MALFQREQESELSRKSGGKELVVEVNLTVASYHRRINSIAGKLIRTSDESRRRALENELQHLWLKLNELKQDLFVTDMEIQNLMEFCEFHAGEPTDDQVDQPR